jgi:galactose mutarotase-like enzyme
VPDEQNSWVALRSAQLSVAVNPLGAQLSCLQDPDGRDLLWNGDPTVWNGRAPILFPIVGALAGGSYRLGASEYRLPRHGFARGRLFDVVELSPATATFRLASDTVSLQVYPFQFELDVQFALQGPTLRIASRVRNCGQSAMTASFGYHPALRWPLPYGKPRADHFIEFEDDEPAPLRRLDTDGLLTPQGYRTPIQDRRLVLDDALFQDDVMIFDQVRSRSVTYGAAEGPRIRLDFADAPYLGVWSKPGAGFVCIEPWHGFADPVQFRGDFTNKPGVFHLQPGATQSMEIAMTLIP